MQEHRLHFPLLPRKKNTDKSSYGHTLVLAGSFSYRGAALLTSRAALVSGSGLVTLGIPQSLGEFFSKKALAETMLLELPQTKKNTIAFSARRVVEDFLKKRRVSAVALGPGLSRYPETARFVRETVRRVRAPIVLDADGLNAFEGKKSVLRKHAGKLVLTPHRKEFERLFEESWPEDKIKRQTLAKKLSRFYDGVLVLKSHETLVAWRDRIYWNKTGNPGMAKGGSGDVLTGIIASFISQGLD